MRFRKGLPLLLVGTAVAIVAGVTAATAAGPPQTLTSVATANPKSQGFSQPNILSPELQEVAWAQGSMKLDGGTSAVPYYGYDGNGPFVPTSFGGTNGLTATEAQKTEPDKNTYLVLNGQHGADPSYNYGTHFLYQGHEATTSGTGAAITRINLDADGAHRVTLLATQTQNGAPLHFIDGSTWDPWSQRLLFTTESNQSGTPPQPTPSVYQATSDYPSKVDDISNVIGRGGFEGIQNDNRGNLYLVEDIGGSTGTGANANTKQPNSFLYRFLPTDPSNLTEGGKLQALQVIVNGTPLEFTSGNPTPTSTRRGTWRCTATTARGPRSGSPSRRRSPRRRSPAPTTTRSRKPPARRRSSARRTASSVPAPASREFWFDETGDTDERTCAGAPTILVACTSPKVSGGYGSIFRLTQSPKSDAGQIAVFFNGNPTYAAFDNMTFFSKDQLGVVEDAGDTLHTQRNGLDSAYMFDVTQDYSHAQTPIRFIAEGRDPSATLDSELSGTGNEGDNEITGIYVSDGDPGKDVLGAKIPQPFKPNGRWRAFWTQQHGDNTTYELIAAPGGGSDDN